MTVDSGMGARGGPDPHPAEGVLARAVFLRALGLVYAAAFVSLWVQVHGLIGERGIAPASELLAVAHERFGAGAAWRLPTVFWLSSGDVAIHLVCAAGTACGALLLLGRAPGPAAIAAWGLYLSLVGVGDVFLSYQWDALLLEAGLLACLDAPWRLRPGGVERAPSRLSRGLLRLLLFRLMFASGAVKLLSGDPSWRNLSALEFHYWTQPLPHLASWFAHRLPGAVHAISTFAMFAVELVVPFFYVGPRRARRYAAVATAGLQVAVAATGNYGFFNLLTAALCVTLLDDDELRRVLPARLVEALVPRSVEPARALPRGVAGFVGGFLGAAGLAAFAGGLGVPVPRPLSIPRELLRPTMSANAYGLFAVMTRERPEIVVEGSDDGRTWRSYDFRWKPGPVERAPRLAPLHLPRLDWQMWFAALSACRDEPWFLQFERALLEGRPEVLGLLRDAPSTAPESSAGQTRASATRPPRFVRSTLYRYRFTTAAERRDGGAWWSREEAAPYCPTLTLVDGRLTRVP